MDFLKIFFFVFNVLLPLTTCSTVESKSHIEELTKGISSFGQDFYKQCSEITPGNLIISPFSTAMPLSLFSQETNGTTFEELQKALHLNVDKATIADQFHQYSELVKRSAGESNILIANRIFVQQGYELLERFQEVATQKFHSGVESVDFKKSNYTATTINQFVKEKTNENIREIVEPKIFNEMSRLFLVNVFYLKSKWVQPFPKDKTRRGLFYNNGMEKIFVETMKIRQRFWSAGMDDLDAKALRLDYANSNLSFVIILPNNRTALSSLESKLTNYNFTRVIDQMEYHECDVTIPKFKVESVFVLNDILKKMGIVSLFNSNADLSGLLKNNESPLYVSDVIHKATIEINENHTEVAAVTGFSSRTKSRVDKFCANHPFVYNIWDRESETTIFIGHITNLPGNITESEAKSIASFESRNFTNFNIFC